MYQGQPYDRKRDQDNLYLRNIRQEVAYKLEESLMKYLHLLGLENVRFKVELNFVERKRQREGRSFWLTLSEKFHQTFSVIPDIQAKNQKKVA